MVNEGARHVTAGGRDSDQDFAAAVAEFIRTRGVTKCPTACVLPTQASVTEDDRSALGEYAARRDQRRQQRLAARVKQIWNVEPAAAPE
jgi:hypothetical protein